MAIYRNVNGTWTLISADVAVGPAAGDNWFVADSFSFGVEREMKDAPDTSDNGGRDVLIGGAGPDIGHDGWLIGNGVDAEASSSLADKDIPQLGLVGATPLSNDPLNFTKVMLKQDQDPTSGGDWTNGGDAGILFGNGGNGERGDANEPWTVIAVTDHGISLPAVQYDFIL